MQGCLWEQLKRYHPQKLLIQLVLEMHLLEQFFTVCETVQPIMSLSVTSVGVHCSLRFLLELLLFHAFDQPYIIDIYHQEVPHCPPEIEVSRPSFLHQNG